MRLDERFAGIDARPAAVRYGLPVTRRLPDAVLTIVVVELALVVVGLIRTPSALTAGHGVLSLAGVVVAQAACAVAARWGPVSVRRVPAAAIKVGIVVGTVTGALYGAEIVGEYVTPALTRASVAAGYVIVTAIVASACVAGAVGAQRGGSWRAGLVSAVWNAIAEYLVWYPGVLVSYYAFSGTAAGHRVVYAEGTLDDFHRSGMTDFPAFVLQDFFGAGLFHLLAGLVIAALFGSAAAALARAVRPAVPSALTPPG